MSDSIHAFVPGPEVSIAGAPNGPLAGLTFAAKDLFDVAGHPTGGGNPDWAAYYPVPTRHAWAVQTLLDAGANLIGKTITDEVSLGILGENPFYGTPLNSAAPDQVAHRGVAASSRRYTSGRYGWLFASGRLRLTAFAPQSGSSVSPAPSSDTTGCLPATPTPLPASRPLCWMSNSPPHCRIN